MKLITTTLLIGILAFALQAQTTVIPFMNPTPAVPTICGDSWVESGLTHRIEPLFASCSFTFDDIAGKLQMVPAALRVELAPLGVINKIEVDIENFCSNCNALKVYDAGGNLLDSIASTVGGTETIIYTNPGSHNVAFMKVCGVESEVCEIRIDHEEVCEPIVQIHAEKGDVYVDDSCYGVILKSPSGFCFRIRVNDLGQLYTVSVPCP